jgi:hypothetical protein
MAALGFVVALRARHVDQVTLQGMTTLPILLGLGALTAAWALARTPHMVTVGSQGLWIAGRRGSRRHSWEQIGWATVGTGALNFRRQLVVFDTRGKTIAKLSEAFDDFDTLVELVNQRIAGKATDTSEQIRVRKSKRTAVFTTSVGVLLLAVAVANVWMAHGEQRAARRLAEAGVPGEAEIVRRFLAPNGVTPRLEYRITTPAGRSATRNAEVLRFYWDTLEDAQTVPVVFVRDEPEISRLAFGEPAERDVSRNPLVMYGLSALLSLISLVAIVAGCLQWFGWDIDLDSQTGKISIKRFGTSRH